MGTGTGGASGGSNTTSSGDFGTDSSAGGVSTTDGGTTSTTDGGSSTPLTPNQLNAELANAGTGAGAIGTILGGLVGNYIEDLVAPEIALPANLATAVFGGAGGVAANSAMNNYNANILDQMQNPDAGSPDAGLTPSQAATLNQLNQAEATKANQDQQLQAIEAEAMAGDGQGAQAQAQALAPQIKANTIVELQDVSALAGANSILGQATGQAAMKAADANSGGNSSSGGGGDSGGGGGDSGGGDN